MKHETCANPACARSFEIPRGKPNQRYCSVRCYHEANGRAGVQAGKRTPAKDQAEAALGAVNVVYEEEALRRPSHPNTPDPVIESKPNPKEDEMILEFRKPRASKSVPLDLLDALDPDDLALYLDARKIEKACALEVHRLREQLQEAERLHRQASIDLDDLKEGLMTRSEAS